jgi:hypothetical protein
VEADRDKTLSERINHGSIITELQQPKQPIEGPVFENNPMRGGELDESEVESEARDEENTYQEVHCQLGFDLSNLNFERKAGDFKSDVKIRPLPTMIERVKQR